jgi:hypothetical protein
MTKLEVLNNEKGYIKLIFVIALIVFLGYLGVKFGTPYYNYSAFKSEAKEIARISLGDREKTRAQIFEKAVELKLPIEEKDIAVTQTGKTVRVKTSWSETVDILGVYQKTLDFAIDIVE